MNLNRKGAAVEDRLKVRILEGHRFNLGFLTGLHRPGLSREDSARGVFTDLAGVLTEHGMQPFQEKIYGATDHREALLSIRHKAYEAAGLHPSELPATFHQGKGDYGDGFSGVQIWGVIPTGPEVSVATVPEGRTWKGTDFRMLYLPGVRGLDEEGRLVDDAPEQARRMFIAAETALEKHDLTFRHVSRTWIYLRRLLDWYDDLNQVRNEFFARQGVGVDSERSFPASTGIQGVTDLEECSMDVLATEGPGVVSRPLRASSRQGSADDYGSAFSRAMSVQVGGLDLVFVSGTASIDPMGNSIHLGDAEKQIVETLACITDLLSSRGAGLEDIHLATLFCKTPEVLDIYRQTAVARGVPDFPVVAVVADVCRDELLVEIEAVAVVALGGVPPSERSEL